MIKKNLMLLMVCSLCPVSMAKNWDVAPNPYLDTPSAITDTVDQFRQLPINRLEAIISNECDRVGEFVNLSINNWSAAKLGRKSEDEAKRYSEMLVQQTIDTQSKMYPFPFGYLTYTALDSIIMKEFLGQKRFNVSQNVLIDRMKSICKYRLANEKYFDILNDPKYSRGSMKPIDLDALQEKNSQGNRNTILSFNRSMPDGSKLTPKGVGKKLGLTDVDLNVVYILMANDIKIAMEELDQPWYVYQYVLNQKYNDYKNFLINGGRNKQFAILALTTKMMKQNSNNYKGINTLSFKEINQLKDESFKTDRNQIIQWIQLLGYQTF